MNSKTNTKIFFLFIASLLFSYSTMGRSPAVEPVTGISIDQYREVDPKNDPGFKWDQDKSKHIRLMGKKSDYSSASSVTTTLLFFAALAAFPLAMWFALMKSFPSTPSQPENTGHQSVTIDLAAERSKREESKDQSSTEKVDKAS